MRINIQNKSLFRGIKFQSFSFLLQCIILYLIPAQGVAQTDLRGYAQNYSALQTTDNYEIISSRNRLQLQLSRSANFGGLYAELDLTQRYHGKWDIELLLKELYVDWFLSEYDIRIGYQKVNWGRADAAFVTDILTPLDLREFVTEDPADLRLGINAISVERYFGPNSFQLIFSPIFQPHLLPDPDSRWFPVQEIDTPFAVQFDQAERSNTVRNIQLAAQYRWRSFSRLDLDFMLMRWTYPIPAYSVDLELFDFPNSPSITLREEYQNSFMAGFSGSLQITDRLILESEALFVKDRLFTSLPFSPDLVDDFTSNLPAFFELIQNLNFQDNETVANKPWLHTMAGLQADLGGTTIRTQAHLESILQYDEEIISEQLFPYFSLLATRSLLRDRLQLFALTRYQPKGEDFWFQFQGTYELADGFELSLGTNLFGGVDPPSLYGHFSFYPYRQNSSLFYRFTFYF